MSLTARLISTFIFSLLITHSAFAGFVDFEQFSDNDSLTTQVPELAFSDATVLTAGVSLNEIEFPPHSYDNVIAVFSGTLKINFDSPMSWVSAYISYADADGVDLYLYLYDINETILAYQSFQAPVSPPDNIISNQFISLGAAGIYSMAVSLDSNNQNHPFLLDDLTYIPEPASYLLVIVGLLGIHAKKVNETN